MGCSIGEKSVEVENSDYFEFLQDSLVIRLDSLSSYEFYYVQYIGNGQEVLINLNKVNNSLDFYELDSGFFLNRIYLGTPEKFGEIIPQGFYFHNSDTIFIYPQYQLNGTLIINRFGEIIQKLKVDFPETNDHPLVFNHVSSPSAATVYFNGRLVGTLANLINTSSGKGIDPNIKKVFELNLSNSKIEFPSDVRYPKEYWGKSVTNLHAFLCTDWVSQEYFIHAYPLMDSVLLYDNQLNFIERKYFGSDYFEDFVELPKETSHLEHFKYIISHTSYGRVLYDPFKKLIYRFVMLKRKYDKEIDHTYGGHHRNLLSVIVADSAFNLKKEVILPGSIYYPYAAFVGKKGLYIPKISKTNPKLSEDEVLYDIFDFSIE